MYKKFIYIAFLYFFLSVFFVKAEKRALIVAIGEYPENSGWQRLSSENDVPLIKSGLQKQGFKDDNIKVVLNQHATKSGLDNAFNELINTARSGDIIVFHFSGHGQQVTDTNGDEIDGLDEALVTYNASKTKTDLILDARFHLLDDELNKYLLKFRKKVGKTGDVLFFIDACHSGTATRSTNQVEGTIRGTNQIYEIVGYENKYSLNEESEFLQDQDVETRSSNVDIDISPFVILSACLAYQTNKEYDNCGSLSYALGKVLSNNLKNTSYQTFFESVRNEMMPLMINSLGVRHDQTPQIEGKTERKVFAGSVIELPRYFTVNNIKRGKISINAGTLAGIFKGAELSFYPAETYDKYKSKPFLTCTVDTSSSVESIMTLPLNFNKSEVFSSWVFVSKYRYTTISHENPSQMRARVLRNISSVSKDVFFRILPLDQNGKVIDIKHKEHNGNIHFKYEDRFVLEVINKSRNPIFFQLVDVAPTDQICLVMGSREDTKYDYYLGPGQSKVFDNDVLKIDKSSPLGLETIVLIASEKVLNLSPIETQKPSVKRAEISDFEEWMSLLYSNERSLPVFDPNKIYIDKKSFIVQK